MVGPPTLRPTGPLSDIPPAPPRPLARPARGQPGTRGGGPPFRLPALRSRTHPGQDPTTYSVVGTWSACTLANSMAGCTVGGARDLSQKLSCLVSTPAHAWTHALISVPLAFKLGRTKGGFARWRKFTQGLGEEVSLAAARVFASASPPSHKSSPI